MQGDPVNAVDPTGETAQCNALADFYGAPHSLCGNIPDGLPEIAPNATNPSLNDNPGAANLIDPLADIPFLSTSSQPGNSQFQSQSQQNAVAYALEYGDLVQPNGNSLYPTFGLTTGDDCTNFVSQVLAAGGFQTDNMWNILASAGISVPFFGNGQRIAIGCTSGSPLNADCTPAWSAAPALLNYLVNTKGFSIVSLSITSRQTGPLTLISGDLSLIQPGDVIFFYQNGLSAPNHAGVIIGWGPPLVYNSNTRTYGLDANGQYVPWFIDHTGSGHARPITDISLPSPLVEIVHIQYP